MTDTDQHTTVTRDGVLGADATEVITVDQATGAELARYPVAGKQEAAAAVAGAVSGPWWDLGFDGRAQRLLRWQQEIAKGGEELAALIHAENGKPTEDARAEVLAALGHLEFVIGNAERVLGRRDVPSPQRGLQPPARRDHRRGPPTEPLIIPVGPHPMFAPP